MYLITGDYDNNKRICDYKDLKELLLSETTRDMIENHEERYVVADGINILKRLIDNKDNFSDIKTDLLSFGYYVEDLFHVECVLNSLQEYNARVEVNETLDKELDNAFSVVLNYLRNIKRSE
jgi:hypothetical protein